MSHIRVIVHRGTHQIGGCCTEIATDDTRILIDMGMPLPGEERVALSINGVTKCGKRYDAILVTHYHGDHIGELSNVIPEVPIYMGKSSKEILMSYKKHMGKNFYDGLKLNDIREVENGVEIKVGSFTITPIESDHSSFQPYMYLIEGNGKRILHTGDFRLHGPHKKELLNKINKYLNIDVLITEGTSINRSHSEQWTEESVQRYFKYLLKRYKYCFLLTSTGNIDRIASFAKGISLGEYFLVDEFQKELLLIANKHKKDEELLFSKIVTYGQNIKDKLIERGFGMVVRANDKFSNIIKSFSNKYPEETCLIYSMWSGYFDNEQIFKITKLIGDKFFICHSSGHVTSEDLNDFMNMVSAQKIIMIHTECDKALVNFDMKNRIINLNDKEEVII